MRTIDFVTKESLRRKRKSLAMMLFVLLAVSIFVATETLNKALHDRTKEQLLRFGANLIVHPKGAPFDLNAGATDSARLLPEIYVGHIRSIDHEKMLVAVSPKLYGRFPVREKSVLVAGITLEERKAKPWWLIDSDIVTWQFPSAKQALLGHFAAGHLGDSVSEIELGGETFSVTGVLDETGSPDDFMVFVPLPELQALTRKEGMANVIEVTTSCIACKAMNIHDVRREIDKALPSDAKVVLVKQIAEAQMGTLMKVMGFTKLIYVIVLSLCAFLLMNYMSASVDERRREIGMLMAMGMDPRRIQAIFVSKVMAFAALGGLFGYAAGSLVSSVMGPVVADTRVSPILGLLPLAFAMSLGLAAISSILPVRRIARLEPVEALKEV